MPDCYGLPKSLLAILLHLVHQPKDEFLKHCINPKKRIRTVLEAALAAMHQPHNFNHGVIKAPPRSQAPPQCQLRFNPHSL
jgi:hypothetical protein